MALIKCPECGKEISDKSDFCVGCGCPIKKSESSGNISTEELLMALLCQKTGYEQWVEDMKAYHPWDWMDYVAKGYPHRD